MESPKLSILGWFTKQLEEMDTAKWATREEEANLHINVLFVSFFEKMNLTPFFQVDPKFFGINSCFLVAATPGFASQNQFAFGRGYGVNNSWYFLFCDWKSSWTLLYKPIDENERKIIDEIVKVNEF